MKQHSSKPDMFMIIAICAMLLSAVAISGSIIYVHVKGAADERYLPDRDISLSDILGSTPDSCFSAALPLSSALPDADSCSESYTTPYGTFTPISSVIEINRYMTINPIVLESEQCLGYITADGSADSAKEIMAHIKQLSDEICAGCKTDLSKAQALAMWTGQNIAYDFDAAQSVVDMNVICLENILNNGMKTTCGGFANLFSALCHSQGIYCLNMKGGSASEGWTRAELENSPANHEWNAVAIDGQWYYADCTWISDLSYKDGELTGGTDIKPFYALFGFGEMSIEHRIDRCEHRCYAVSSAGGEK